MMPAGIKLGGLAGKLVNDGLLAEDIAIKCSEEARKKQISFVKYIVDKKYIDSAVIAQAASFEFGVPLFDLSVMDIEQCPISLVKEKLVRQHHALPLFKRGKRLFVAISDPTNVQALDEIKFHTGITTDPVLVEEDKLTQAIEDSLNAQDSADIGGLLDDDYDNIDISMGEEEVSEPDSDIEIDDTPVVRFVNKVLLDAINKGASDIHFEPYEKKFRVRFRQDGVLHEVAAPPVTLASRITARIKVMSRLDIAERRVPQDGRIKMNITKKRSIDFRVNSCPTLWGEKVVLRILDSSSAMMGIEKLGYDKVQRERYEEALASPYGMILVTGPTGSGKTVSLYTGLNILNTEDRNISTVEDPVEINLPGINQVNTNPRAGLDFASALRAFLRQDPDVVMVGEVRDLETAEIAIKAALTGHLVLSTLHTNDAPQTLTRLANMGVPAFNIASAVSLIIAQRLARLLCPYCKTPVDIPKEALLEEGFKESDLNGLQLYGAVGCDQCVEGYKGRVGIYQVMPVSEAIGRIIMEGGNALEIADQAKKEGIADLRESGLAKVKAGVTSLEEINRVTTKE